MRRSVRARLIRDVTVHLLDFSWSGCLVAADQEIEPGTSGELRVTIGGTEHRDTVRIVRRTRRRGSSHAMTLGGRFGWGRGEGRASVRAKVPTVVTLP